MSTTRMVVGGLWTFGGLVLFGCPWPWATVAAVFVVWLAAETEHQLHRFRDARARRRGE